MILITLLVVVIPSLVVIPAIFALTVFFLFRAPVAGLGDQVRTARYLFAYDNALEWLGLGRKRRKEIVAELTANIVDASAHAPVGDVLARLGHPKDLARGFASGAPRPTWLHGIAAGVLVWSGVQYATFAVFDALRDSVAGQAGAEVVARTALLPGTDFAVASDATGAAGQFTMQFGWLSLLAPLVAFALFSRPWRLIAARRHAPLP